MTELKEPYQIEIAGVGGTGVLTAANLLGNSALVQNIYVVQSEIHGMAQRGGVVNTEIRFGPVTGPLIPDFGADILLSFELGETARAMYKLKPKTGYVIMNSHIIIPPSLSAKRGAKYPAKEDIV
ncbi:MAG: 2-oxoacid:acceptor oxidoreductase family protein, partial [Candidatus Heimdallarchaeota archaeon]